MTDDTFSEVRQVRGLLGPNVSPYNSEGEEVLLPFLLHQYHQPPQRAMLGSVSNPRR